MQNEKTYTAFAGMRLIIAGDLKSMLLRTKKALDEGETETILIFEDQTGNQIDFDFRGMPEDVLARLSTHPHFAPEEIPDQVRTGPGRPKLGVVSREISLLPRHWEWLDQQPGGISVTMRKLVEEARKKSRGSDLARSACEAIGKFMWAMAGNLPDFEEASRALYARDYTRLLSLIRNWPPDIRNHIERLAGEAERLEIEADTSPTSL
jgi:uncharacterized protein